MKPSDFFIGSREFFGALIPGLIWLAAFVLIFIDKSIYGVLIYASSTNWVGALSFAGLALLLGTLLQSRAFSFARRVHRFLREVEQPDSKYPRISRFLGNRFLERYLLEDSASMCHRRGLIEQAQSRIRGHMKGAYQSLNGEKMDLADQLYQGERQIFTACKRSVLARSPELGRLLKEKEAEVNLIGTLPLPLLFLTLGLLLHSRDISELPLRFNHLSLLWDFAIGVFAVVAITYLLLRFHASRKEEVRMCLESFLLIECALAESPTPGNFADGNTEKE